MIRFLKNLNVYIYFLITFIFVTSSSIIMSVLYVPGETNETVQIIKQYCNFPIELILSGVVLPLWETFIFQFLIINFTKSLLKRFKTSTFFAITLSALLFGFAHNYTFEYFIYGTFMGVVFASIYYFSQFIRKENGFLILFLLHASYNTLATLIEYFLNF